MNRLFGLIVVPMALVIVLLAAGQAVCFAQTPADDEPNLDAWAEIVIPGPGDTPVAPSVTPVAPSAAATPGSAPTAKPVAGPPATGRIAFTVFNPDLAPAPCDLFVANADGSDRRLLAQGACQPHMRSDGQILARGSDTLYLIDGDTGVKENVSPFDSDIRPSWAIADGEFVFTNAADHGIIVQDWPSRDALRTTLHYGQPSLSGNTPAWLPDGRIVYNGCNVWENSGSCGLYVVNRAGATPVQITTGPTDLAPDAYEDGIVFMSNRDGNWDVYRTTSDGGDVVRLTDSPDADGLPVWSPDGAQIAYVSNSGGPWAIWRMNADGTGQERLFELGGPPGKEWTEERISWIAAKQ